MVTLETARIAWAPGFHAKWVERASLPSSLVVAAQRPALEALLRRHRAEERVDVAFAGASSPSRYCDGSHPAFYAARDATTALREKLHHDAKQRRRLGIGAGQHAVELLHVDVAAELDDVRALARTRPELTHDSDYTPCQQLARERFDDRSNGLLYPSARDVDAGVAGDCAVLFVRSAIGRVSTHKAISVEWNGDEFVFAGP